MLLFAVLWLAASAVPAAAASSSHLRALDRMMAALAPESAHASRTMHRVYRQHLELLMLEEYADLRGALDTGGLAPLPIDPHRFNVVPRLGGAHPIGEKDLRNQESYVAARPAALGALLEIASQVRSGPVEVTSLVRHAEYQDALRTTNANARTSVPTHTMGLAFDIALINTPIKTAYEIRNVLRRMQKAGDILFIGERRQLVFHVVPHPSRLGHFSDVYYERVIGAPEQRVATGKGAPDVVTEVVSIVPHDERLREVWDAIGRGDDWDAIGYGDDDESASSTAPAQASVQSSVSMASLVATRNILAIIAALAAAAVRILARSRS